ncbi:YciI family protein [Litoribacter populi]|uniref:YciI family protein n=1 Tax=Litoribacter populi TaxID=2598460 RepID=UPI00117C7BBD|nr:YciI family protein [Litoribacter populi]
MKTQRQILGLAFLLLPLLFCQNLAAQETYDQKLAEQYKADDYGMKTYVMAFLKRGEKVEKYSPEERTKIQKGHMENISQLAAEGKLVLAGPFIDGDDLRGIFLFDVATIEEAEELTSRDPAIKAGVLRMELIQWYGSAALMAIPELSKKVQKKSF